MRNKIVEEFLSKLTPEQKEKRDNAIQERITYSKWLEDNGYKYGTSTSITLRTVREANFNPIGICWYGGEETLIFKTQKEANSAYKKLEKEQKKVYAYWYSKRGFLEEIAREDEFYKPSEIYWL